MVNIMIIDILCQCIMSTYWWQYQVTDRDTYPMFTELLVWSATTVPPSALGEEKGRSSGTRD